MGIAPEDQKVVFEEFKRLGKRGKGTKRGLGLGLAIVDRIAKLLGHEIRMRSEIDKGSLFEVLVPLASRADARPSIGSLIDKAPASSLDGTIILCVDKWGASPLIANNSEDAVDHLRELGSNGGGCPSILLVDYHLDDDVTGIQVIEELRAQAETDIPAIIVTADHTQSVRDKIRDSGHALLHKPIKPAALRALMSRILSRQ
jgi:CheY-like chemotaxis protein